MRMRPKQRHCRSQMAIFIDNPRAPSPVGRMHCSYFGFAHLALTWRSEKTTH